MYKEQAIVLIRYNETNHKYEVTQEAAALLASIDTPIAIVSVAGLYRTGKSYLLNRMLLNRSSGFGVGPTINPCTKGLWMWGQPIRSQAENGTPLTLLVIDTEGLGALDEDQTHDVKIFSLAILLSTCFVYNSVGSIDQNAIQSLNMVLNLTDHISKVSRGDGSFSASEMPNFVWVVRDFSLQLIDDKGNNITAKQYLENALAQQKGSSKETEEKNKIRKFITQCFSTRECFTLYKPLIHEQRLQALDKVPLEELRPQFVEQVIALRKRVMGKLKVKTMKGVPLTGQPYLTTIKCYVDAINEGAVPNIQNAWDYMCLEQNTKRIQQSSDRFDTYVKESVQQRMPCLQGELRQILAHGIEQSTAYLKSKLLGQNLEPLDELRKRLEKKCESIMINNARQSASASLNLITKEYQQINKKLKSNYYNKFAEFEAELRSLCSFMLQKNRRFASCQVTYLEFVNKRLIEGSQHFSRMLEQQIEMLKATKADTTTKLQKDLSDLKSQAFREKARLTEDINRLQRERIEMQMLNDQTGKQFKQMVSEHQSLEQHYKQKVERLTRQLDATAKELRVRDHQLQEKQLETERVSFLKNGQWQKEKALNEQQVRFLKGKLEEAERKEKQLDSTLQQLKSEFDTKIRETQQNNQMKIKSLTLQLEEKVEKLTQMADANNRMRQELKSMEQFSEKKQRKLKEDLQFVERALESYKNSGTLQQNRLMVENINEKKTILLRMDEEREKVRLLQIQLKEQSDQAKLYRTNMQKDKAIYSQKIQFQEIQLNELRSKHTELQNKYHDTVAAFENASKQRLDEAQRALVFDLKTAHEQQLKEIEIDNNSKQKQLRNELELSKKKRQELELQLQLDSKRSQEKERQLRDTLKKVEDMYERLQREKLSSQQGNMEIKKELQCHYSIKIRKLEQQLQEIKEKSKLSEQDLQTKSQDTLRQLKNYFEIQKQRLERRVQQEKDKGQRKAKRLLDDAQHRFAEQRSQLEQENQTLKESLAELQSITTQKMSNMQYEFEVAIQKLNNELLQKKIDFNKQVAVMQQQLDYNSKRMEEMTKEKEMIIAKSEERIRQVREQSLSEARQIVARVNEEKAQTQAKNEKLKKSLRQAEGTLNKLNIEYEREKTSFKEKVTFLQSKLEETEERFRHQKRLLDEQMIKLNENHKVERNGLMKEIQKCKDANLRLQNQKQDLISKYESEKNLLLTRMKFNDEQKKRAKQDYDDILNKFETTVKHLNKERQTLQNQRNQSANQVALALKSQYEREAEAIKNNNNRIVRDLEDKINRLTSQKKALNDKIMALQVRINSMGTQNNTENQRRLIRQNQKLKQESEIKLQEYQALLDTQRKENRRTVERLESRLADTDKRKTEYENDKWNGNAVNLNFKDTTNVKIIKPLIDTGLDQKKSRLSTTPITNLGSTTSTGNLLSNLGQGLIKRPERYQDGSDFGGIMQFNQIRKN